MRNFLKLEPENQNEKTIKIYLRQKKALKEAALFKINY